MVRDFSNESKQKMLGLIDEIENDNENYWIDLAGDLWNRFQTWMGFLNIKHYADNVATYHRKVFDMRNTSKSNIENIFSDVAKVDNTYKTNLSNVNTVLRYWQNYISKLCDVMVSDNGGFNSNFNRHDFSKILQDISSVALDDHEVATENEIIDRILSVIKSASKSGAKLIEKYSKNDNQTISNKLGFAGSIVSFLTGLFSFTTNEYRDGWDFTSGILGILKSTGEANNAVYKFISKSLGYYEGSIYESANQGKMGIVSLVSSVLGFTKETINTVKVLTDPNTEGYEKVNQVLTNITSVFGVGQSAIAVKYGAKAYEKVGNIWKWKTPTANAKIVNNASAAVTIATMYVDALKGGIEKHHEVTQDGELSMEDMADIGMAFALKGLASEANSITFGLTDALFDLSGHTDDIQRGIKKIVPSITEYYYNQPVSKLYMEKASFLKDYADNQQNDVGSRIVASVAGGTGMIAAMTIDNIFLTKGGWIISGWNYINNTFLNNQ